MYRALISHCHIYIRMILNCPRCTQIKLHSWHHSHWIFFIFHVILESYSNLYGTAYPFLSSRAHIWVLCDSWYLSLIFSFCWRVTYIYKCFHYFVDIYSESSTEEQHNTSVNGLDATSNTDGNVDYNFKCF
jgi:hypothetical protein